jgi:hypothetical protein
VINRLIVSREPMRFMFFQRLEPLCREYAFNCIDVPDFKVCADGAGKFPPISGVCPMMEALL